MNSKFFAAVLIALAPTRLAAEAPLIFIAPDVEPFYVAQADCGPGGRIGDLVTALADEAGLAVDGVLYPIARAVDMLAKGAADLTIMPKRAEFRAAGVLRSARPVAADALKAYWPPGAPPVTAPSVDELSGRTVVAIHGYAYGGLVERLSVDPSVTIKFISDPEAWLRYLGRRRGDVGLLYEGVYREARGRLEQPIPAFGHITLGFVFGYLYVHPDANGDGARILDKLERAYARLTDRDDPVVQRAYVGGAS